MKKMIYKNDCKYTDGYIVDCDGNVIQSPVLAKIQKLEHEYQHAVYDQNVESVMGIAKKAVDSIPEFEYETTRPKFRFQVNTPSLDEAVDKALEIVEDIDRVEVGEKVSAFIDEYRDVLEFTKQDYIVTCDCTYCDDDKLDLPNIGNPLELDAQDIIPMFVEMSGGPVTEKSHVVEATSMEELETKVAEILNADHDGDEE